jgi:hypothetical protein
LKVTNEASRDINLRAAIKSETIGAQQANFFNNLGNQSNKPKEKKIMSLADRRAEVKNFKNKKKKANGNIEKEN